MSKFYKIGDGCWKHEDIGIVAFPRKPPKWIAQYLIEISTKSYDQGAQHAMKNLRDALSKMGMATIDDIEPTIAQSSP